MELNIEEFEEIVTKNLKSKQTSKEKADKMENLSLLPRKKTLSVKQKRLLRKQNLEKHQNPDLLRLMSRTSGLSQNKDGLDSSQQVKKEPLEMPPLELEPPPGFGESDNEKLAEAEGSDFEFNPFG